MTSASRAVAPDVRSRHTKIAWIVVTMAALGLSWWSLYTLAHGQYGMPRPLAAIVSTVYDGGALVLADLSQRYARSQDSGAAPRTMMLALIGVSAWLNYRHATTLHYSLPGQVMFASPPVVAGALFEIEQRFEHREALRIFGRVAPALPAFGRYAWILHPARTIKRVWLITASRVDSVPLTVLDIHFAPDSATADGQRDSASALSASSAETFLTVAPEPGDRPAPFLSPDPDPESDTESGESYDGSAYADVARAAGVLLGHTPPAWVGMTLREAVARADSIIPDLSARMLSRVLAEVGIDTTEASIRSTRSALKRMRPRTESVAEV